MARPRKLLQLLPASSSAPAPAPAPAVAPKTEVAPEAEEVPVDVEIQYLASSDNDEEPVPDRWSQQRWRDILTREERHQRCPRCREMGHALVHCPYRILNLMTPDAEGRERFWAFVWQPPTGIYRCSRCGRRGHNRRTCHGPVFYE